ncbi:hypothetical protein QBC43DRAFT_373511 [Cladorrhinum sp. PSN259]|nr:hypothetical protein QBC43DRAFT_373511 [Cladorrhinum sp. PSN259]
MKRIVIVEDGNLILVVGGRNYEFLVCSTTLSRVSPVFKRMLSGALKEARPQPESGRWKILLQDDDDNVMAVGLTLKILHSCVQNVPMKLTLGQIYEALIFAEKYQVTQHFRPWLEVDDSGQLLTVEGKKPIHRDTRDKPLDPPGLWEREVSIRLNILNDSFRILREFVEKLLTANSKTRPGYCTQRSSDSEVVACNTMVLGSIMKVFDNEELLVILNASEEPLEEPGLRYTSYANDLWNQVHAINVACEPVSETLWPRFAQIYRTWKNPVTPDLLRTMRKRVIKSKPDDLSFNSISEGDNQISE